MSAAVGKRSCNVLRWKQHEEHAAASVTPKLTEAHLETLRAQHVMAECRAVSADHRTGLGKVQCVAKVAWCPIRLGDVGTSRLLGLLQHICSDYAGTQYDWVMLV